MLRNIEQAFRARQARWEYFPAALPRRAGGRTADFLERGERRVHLALVVLLADDAEVLDQVAKRNDSAISSARLISSTTCRRFDFTGSVMLMMRVRTGASPDVVVVHRRVQRVQLQLGIAEPVAQFGDLRPVVIIQVLAGAENLDQRNARVPDPVQPDRGEAMIHEADAWKGT